MIAAAAWVWALVGIAAFLLVGIAVMLALGLLSLPGAALRRAGQSAPGARVEHGAAVPDEVPKASAAEVAAEVDEQQEG